MILKDEQTGERYEVDEIASLPNSMFCKLKLLDTKEEWPKEDDVYWYVNEYGELVFDTWSGSTPEKDNRDFMGVYRTKELAEQARDRIASIKDAVVTHCQAIKNGYLDNDLPQQAEIKLFIDKKYLKAWEALNEDI